MKSFIYTLAILAGVTAIAKANPEKPAAAEEEIVLQDVSSEAPEEAKKETN